jgi:subtilisin family serine protease
MLDIAVKSPSSQNASRAQHGSSFAIEPAGVLPADIAETLGLNFDTPRLDVEEAIQFHLPGIRGLGSADSATDPALLCSVFVQLDRDLSPERREQAKNQVLATCSRVRWKRDNAVVEVRRAALNTLRTISGVAYVDAGESLSGPQPIVGRERSTLPGDRRRINRHKDRHRFGQDVLVGIIDVEGFDFAHEDFLDENQETRWLAIWDQGGNSARRPPPHPGMSGRDFDTGAMQYGSEILKEHMDRALRASRNPKYNMPATLLEPQSQMRQSSHGTHVASIAAGNSGVARRAYLAGVLVKLDDVKELSATSFYDSTRIADAVEYLFEVAAYMSPNKVPMPISINISLGTNGHAHDGSSPMARWIDDALSTEGRCVTVAAGNAGQTAPASATDTQYVAGRIHAAGRFAGTNLRQELGWMVGADGREDFSDNKLEIWYQPQDRITVELRLPGGDWIEPVRPGNKIDNMDLPNGTVVSIYSETYHPANGLNRISIVLSPDRGSADRDTPDDDRPVTAGEWRVRLTATVVRDGRYDAWIERDDPSPRAGAPNQWNYPSYFSEGSFTTDRMINSLACAGRIISVANVDSDGNCAHPTSSRGPTRDGRNKPDIAADGTGIVAARALGGDEPWTAKTGTSMASPYVCGVAALMLAVSPRLISTQILAMMLTTSMPLVGHNYAWRSDTGFGLIEARQAVDAAVTYDDAVNEAH